MKAFVLLIVSTGFVVACGSPAVNHIAKTNVNAPKSVPYEQTENAYRLAQTDLEVAPLKEFVGKTASEMKLWQNKDVVPRFRDLMGADFDTMLRFWNTETPLKKFGDVMMLTGCETRNCDDNKYVVFLSTSEGLIKVLHIDKDKIREWSPRSNIYLPPVFEKELEAMRYRKEEENGN